MSATAAIAAIAVEASQRAEHQSRCATVLNTKPETVSQMREYSECVSYTYPQPEPGQHGIDWIPLAIVASFFAFIIGSQLLYWYTLRLKRNAAGDKAIAYGWAPRWDWYDALIGYMMGSLCVWLILLLVTVLSVYGIRVGLGR